MITTLITAYINILQASVSLLTTTFQMVYQAIKPTITIPLGEKLSFKVSDNTEALNKTVDYCQEKMVNTLKRIEEKLKHDMTIKELVISKHD